MTRTLDELIMTHNSATNPAKLRTKRQHELQRKRAKIVENMIAQAGWQEGPDFTYHNYSGRMQRTGFRGTPFYTK
jgi:hypothetical protein